MLIVNVSFSLKGVSGDAKYVLENGEKVLYFNGGQGLASIPSLTIPDKAAIMYWAKPINTSVAEKYILSIIDNNTQDQLLGGLMKNYENKHVFRWRVNSLRFDSRSFVK